MAIEYAPGWHEAFLWAAIVGFILAFLVAFGLGANDAANSYGTVVGSGVLKLWQAYILATVFESVGAALLGDKVVKKMVQGVVEISTYDVDSCNTSSGSWITNCSDDNTTLHYTDADFIVGELGALAGTAFWLMAATIFQLPVSTTHSAVGATVGFSIVLRGSAGIKWMEVLKIVLSWVASPLMAGIVSVSIYMFIKYTCLKRDDPFEASLRMLPAFYWFAISVNLFSSMYDGSEYLKLDKLEWYKCLPISIAVGGSVALVVWLWGAGALRRRINKRMKKKQSERSGETGTVKELEEMKQLKNGSEEEGLRKSSVESLPAVKNDTDSGVGFTPLQPASTGASTALLGDSKNGTKSTTPKANRESTMVDASCLKTRLKALKQPVKEHPLAAEVFHYLQILSACFLSFSHGSNDTANAVGPLVGLWLTYKGARVNKETVNDDSDKIYLIMFGVAGMIIGLWALGHKVIETIGTNLVTVTAPSGFAMEIGTATTVLLASKLGIPVSTTHCAVGSVIAVGWMQSQKDGVSWKTFRNIAIAWVVTVPVAGLMAGLIAYLLRFAI